MSAIFAINVSRSLPSTLYLPPATFVYVPVMVSFILIGCHAVVGDLGLVVIAIVDK